MKKADISLETITGLVLGSLLIVGLVFFIGNIVNSISNKPDQATLNNFDTLSLTIEDLVSSEKESATTSGFQTTRFGDIIKEDVKPAGQSDVYVEIPFYVKKGKKIIGFDRAEISYDSNKKLERPAVCGDSVCLCLAKNLDGKQDSYEKCAVLKNIQSISTAANTKEYALNRGSSHTRGYSLLWDANKDYNVMLVRISKMPVLEQANNFDIFIQILPKTQ